jgi:hypothetical protein
MERRWWGLQAYADAAMTRRVGESVGDHKEHVTLGCCWHMKGDLKDSGRRNMRASTFADRV